MLNQGGIISISIPAAVAFCCLFAGSMPAPGESFRERLERAHNHLKTGDVERSIDAYRDLQTERPESEVVLYNLGCAHCRKAFETGRDAPVELFERAVKYFDRARASTDPELARRAWFNSINTTAWMAEQSVSVDAYEDAIEAFESCIAEYERFLEAHPHHQRARHNLDHARYRLKKMLQHPPPDETSEARSEQDEKGDQTRPDEDCSGKSDDSQSEQSRQARREEPTPEQQEQDPRSRSQESPQHEASDAQQDRQAPGQKTGSGNDAPPRNAGTRQTTRELDAPKQNIEAILQSIEDMDKRESYDTIHGRKARRPQRNWW